MSEESTQPQKEQGCTCCCHHREAALPRRVYVGVSSRRGQHSRASSRASARATDFNVPESVGSFTDSGVSLGRESLNFTLEKMVELLHSSGEDLEHDFDALQSRVDATSLMLGRGFANISAILLNSLPEPKDAVRKIGSRYQFTHERRFDI